MKKLILLFLLVYSITFMTEKASAVSLQLLPTSQNTGKRAPAGVLVVISDLGSGGPPSLGAFDLGVIFNPNLLSIQDQDVGFGRFLGDVGLGEALTNINTPIPAIVELSEVSLLFENQLDDLQPGRFVLADLQFRALSKLGVSPLEFTRVVLSDPAGNVLPVSTISGARINIVPEPATLLLFGSGLASLIVWRIKRTKLDRA